MRIHLKIVGFHDMKINEDICLSDGSIIKDIVDKLSEENEMFKNGMRKNHIVIMKNGVSAGYLQGVDTPLRDGDYLLISPMQFGG